LGLRVSGFLCRLLLAGKLLEAGATGGKLGLLDDQNGKAVLDAIPKPAALANEAIAFQMKACRPARIGRAADKFFEKLRTNHQRNPILLVAGKANGL
jgi:hypothetical protein